MNKPPDEPKEDEPANPSKPKTGFKNFKRQNNSWNNFFSNYFDLTHTNLINKKNHTSLIKFCIFGSLLIVGIWYSSHKPKPETINFTKQYPKEARNKFCSKKFLLKLDDCFSFSKQECLDLINPNIEQCLAQHKSAVIDVDNKLESPQALKVKLDICVGRQAIQTIKHKMPKDNQQCLWDKLYDPKFNLSSDK